MISKIFVYALVFLTVAVFDCVGIEAKERTYCLSFINLKILPMERLSKFDLHIESAIITSFPSIPVGWRIKIANEANWMPEMSGAAIEQAADLEKRAFANNFIDVTGIPPELAKYGMTDRIAVSGYLEFSHGDVKRVVPVSNTNVTLTADCRSEPKR